MLGPTRWSKSFRICKILVTLTLGNVLQEGSIYALRLLSWNYLWYFIGRFSIIFSCSMGFSAATDKISWNLRAYWFTCPLQVKCYELQDRSENCKIVTICAESAFYYTVSFLRGFPFPEHLECAKFLLIPREHNFVTILKDCFIM